MSDLSEHSATIVTEEDCDKTNVEQSALWARF
jgi:hypothetical protein